jgi:hypothetical protein
VKHFSSLHVLLVIIVVTSTASAATHNFEAFLDGLNASPPNNSPATGLALVNYDDIAHTLTVDVSFRNLQGFPSGSHIHAPTAAPYSGLALVATTQPSFIGFPTNVATGTYHTDLDLTNESSFNPTFDGGTPATQEVALMSAISSGRAYLNIHTSAVPSGEIIGFFISLPGDYNHDGFVDAADYTVWRDSFGQMGAGLAADSDGSNMVDEADYMAWQQNFGHSRLDFTPGRGNAAAVAEPSTIVAVGTACIALLLGRRR